MDISAMILNEVGAIPYLARIVGFFLIAPPFSSKLAPTSVKIGLAIILWLCTHPQPPTQKEVDLLQPILVLSELIVGLSLGFFIQILFTAFDVAGELISNGMGLTFPGQFNPLATDSAGPVSGLAQMLGVAVFFASGGIEHTIGYLSLSFEIVHLGDVPKLMILKNKLLPLLSQCVYLGIAGSLAIWVSLLLANILMLVSSRLAGGLNLMNSGLPLLLIVGLVLMALLLIPTINNIWASMPNASLFK